MSQHHPNQGAWNNFTYDAQNRLTSGYGLPYTYDSAGRMTSYENSGATAFRAHAVRDRYNSQWYYYDANGNMTSRWTAGGWQNLTWDHENHLSTVSGGGLPTESYLYDADGQRVKKISGGVATYYPNPYYEVSGSTITKYYYFHGQRVAMRTNASGGWVHYDLHSDHLGSTVFVTAQTGATHSTEGYYAYGRTRTGGIPVTDQKFTGQKRDGTGLQYFNARYYDPELGHFISPDTLVPDPSHLFDYNRYMYTRGNPMKYNDPTGHCVNSQTTNAGDSINYDNADCWRYANTIANLWDSTDYWSNRFGAKENFLKDVAADATNGTDFFQSQFSSYLQSAEYQGKHGQFSASSTPDPSDPMCGNDMACQAVVQHALYMNQKCQEIDCVGIGNDVVGVAGAGMVLLCPECGAVGLYLSYGSTGAGVVWTTYNWYNDRSSEADLAVTAELAWRGVTTTSKPWGLAYSVTQLVWDAFVSPHDPWE